MQTGETSWVSQMMLDVGYFINSGVLCRAPGAERPRTSQNSHVAPTAVARTHCQVHVTCNRCPASTLRPLIMHSQHYCERGAHPRGRNVCDNWKCAQSTIQSSTIHVFFSFYRLSCNYSTLYYVVYQHWFLLNLLLA